MISALSLATMAVKAKRSALPAVLMLGKLLHKTQKSIAPRRHLTSQIHRFLASWEAKTVRTQASTRSRK
jgi:hypothetical protein